MYWHWHLRLIVALLAVAWLELGLAAAEQCIFRNPTEGQPGKGYASNMVEHVGSILTVQYNTTIRNYTIAIWQQSLKQAAAKLGPIVFQTTQATVQEFDWPVQLYNFKLSESDTFFFWLREGAADKQGVPSASSCTSHYFNMTSKPLVSSSASSVASSATLTKSTSAVSTVFRVTTTSSPDTSSSPSTSPTPAPSTPSEGLTRGAAAGIGVCAAIIAIVGFAALVMTYRHYRRKREKMRVAPPPPQSPLNPYPSSIASYYHRDGSTIYSSTGSHGATMPEPFADANTWLPAMHQVGDTHGAGRQPSA